MSISRDNPKYRVCFNILLAEAVSSSVASRPCMVALQFSNRTTIRPAGRAHGRPGAQMRVRHFIDDVIIKRSRHAHVHRHWNLLTGL